MAKNVFLGIFDNLLAWILKDWSRDYGSVPGTIFHDPETNVRGLKFNGDQREIVREYLLSDRILFNAKIVLL